MKRCLCFLFLMIYLFGFSAEHSQIEIQVEGHPAAQFLSSDILQDHFIQNSDVKDFKSSDVNSHQHEESCSECILGFCMHLITVPAQLDYSFPFNKQDLIHEGLANSFYKDPFTSGLKRPPRV